MHISTEQYKQLLYVTECLSFGLNSAEVRTAVGDALLKLLDAEYYASYVWDSVAKQYGEGVALNMDKKKLLEYEQYYQFNDPITHKLQARQQATCVNEVINQKSFEKTEFYNDFLCHDGLHWGINLHVFDGEKNMGDIRVWRSKKRNNFDPTSAHLLQMIRPHFSNALRNMHNHNNTVEQHSPIITASLDNQLMAKEFGFTARETEIAKELLKGKKDEEIANDLFIACSTLRTHVQHIYNKAGVHNRTSLCHKILNQLTGLS